MRTLIVDNYDSFTFNLFQALAEINGTPPTVLRNDARWDPDELSVFDNVVISPGPGHPANRRDFGLSREVVNAARVPLLGVCLGHQGLCLLAGARVEHAPEVRHGRLSSVRHDGADLFAGLPSPLRVVRYHSLAVRDLPEEIEATAWAADGVLMGVRHRDRPAWGVQFHPESVCTEHGREMLANFAELTRRWWVGHPREVARIRGTSAAPEPAEPAAHAPTMRVLVERMIVTVTAEEAFNAVYPDSEHAFWLDSAGGGRFSFLGDASGPLARVARADVWAGRVAVESAAGTEVVESGFFDWLDAELAGTRVDVDELPFGFTLGWVGYLGYELKAECGGARAHRSADPDAVLIFADRGLVFDHASGEVYLLALAPVDDEADARTWLAGMADRLAALASAPLVRREAGVTAAEDVRLRHDRAEYLDMIARCLAAIHDGESYETCLTNLITARVSVDPVEAYRYLRRRSPAPRGALLRLGELSVLSTSPERFLAVSPDGDVESRPIKGTRPRGRTPEEDELLRHDLASDEKDRAENLMIVDLVRNDLGVCAEIGSVHVPAIFEVESYASVHHLVSTIRARLAPERSAVRCMQAAFPPGSMTGAPKIRTMEILDRLEGGPRGVYSGVIGYFSLSGAVDLSVVIRTMVVRQGTATFGVGGAIIALSDPDAEFEETAVKAAPMLDLLGVELDPEGGFCIPGRTDCVLRDTRTRAPLQGRTR